MNRIKYSFLVIVSIVFFTSCNSVTKEIENRKADMEAKKAKLAEVYDLLLKTKKSEIKLASFDQKDVDFIKGNYTTTDDFRTEFVDNPDMNSEIVFEHELAKLLNIDTDKEKRKALNKLFYGSECQHIRIGINLLDDPLNLKASYGSEPNIFEPEYYDKFSSYDIEQTKKEINDFLNIKYVLVPSIENYQKYELMNSKEFNPGVVQGKAYLFSVDDVALIGAFDFLAMNTSYVEYKYHEGKTKEARQNLETSFSLDLGKALMFVIKAELNKQFPDIKLEVPDNPYEKSLEEQTLLGEPEDKVILKKE